VQILPTTTAVAKTTNTPSPTLAPTPLPEPPVQVIDLLAQNVQTGQWAEGQALVNLLSYAAGKKTAREVFEDTPVKMDELSGLMEQANQYLKMNPNAPERKQLEDLIAVLAPDAKRILPYARPEESASTGQNTGQTVSVAYHRPSPRLDVDCQTINSEGFPTPKPGETPPVCVLYKQFQVLGKTYRIFYPKTMNGSGATQSNLSWAVDALKTSAETYKALEGKTIPNTDLIFVTLPYDQTKEGLGIAASAAISSDQICQIQAYKNIEKNNEGYFKQTIAHEMFHCYQQAFMKTADQAPYAKSKWWIEGSAEFFSNVVYPKVNIEFMFADAMDKRSVKESLLDLSYENDFFFQYMANQITPEGVLKVLAVFPASGERAAYLTSLSASIPDFEKFFHGFGQAYLDSLIQDSGGGAIPFAALPGDPVTLVESGSQPLDTQPFTITRFRLIYEKGKYTQQETATGKGMDTARPRDTVGTWAALPGEVGANCGKRALVLLVTSVTPAHNYMTTIDYAKDEDETDCDQCLIGSWKLNPVTFNNYMASVQKPPVEHIQSTADLNLTFTPDSIMQVEFNQISNQSAIKQGNASGGTKGTTIDIEIAGESMSEFSTNAGILYLTNTQPALTVKIRINGQDMGSNGIDPSTGGWNFLAPADQYTCSNDTLTFIPQINANPAPLEFWRMK
jgi:hypothetical protein